ncbi:uncharacterized protein LOC131881928 [Tigriopus californicus]|uniref:uncharacterized protein LOC131881928 n=1 Tax=Tigriopus californicus TaxID=6832 RepID=UPI0027DA0F80|nr:uncharacterized protein LOC131881928 [Tigriopus californicus]
MAMVGQVGFACIGGILGIFWGTGFLEFMFWSSFFVSLSLLLSHLVNATQSLETAFPWLIKVELGYALIWGCLTTLAAVLAFLFFGLYILPALIGFALALCFFVDLFFKYRNYTRVIEPTPTTGGPA